MGETARERSVVAPRWAPPASAALFVVVAIVFQRLAAPADAWFARLDALAFLGVVFDFLLIFVAAMLAAAPVLRRYRDDPAPLRRRLTRAFCIGYWAWQAVSFLIVAEILKFAPVTASLALFGLAEAAVGALTILGAVALCAGLLKLTSRRRAKAAPAADLTGKPI